MPEVASQTFDLVGREVNATLAEARGALETYVEQPDNVTLLDVGLEGAAGLRQRGVHFTTDEIECLGGDFRHGVALAKRSRCRPMRRSAAPSPYSAWHP